MKKIINKKNIGIIVFAVIAVIIYFYKDYVDKFAITILEGVLLSLFGIGTPILMYWMAKKENTKIGKESFGGMAIILVVALLIAGIGIKTLINVSKDLSSGPITIVLSDCEIENKKIESYSSSSATGTRTSIKYKLKGIDSDGKEWELEIDKGDIDSYIQHYKQNGRKTISLNVWENTKIVKEIISGDAKYNQVY